MAYRHQYSGSPWQQGGPPFGVGGYNQGYGGGYGVNDQYGVSHQMMNSGYNRNQGGYGSMYGSGGGGMSQMRNMGYGPSPSRHYMNDRMGGRQMSPRGQMQRKRPPQRSPGGPRSKRPNLDSDSRRMRMKQRRRRDSRGGSKGRGRDQSDDEQKGDEPYNPAEPTDDASDTNYDDYESWKSSSEDEDESKEKKEISKENGEEEKVDGEKETEEGKEKEETDDKAKDEKEAGPKKPLVCHVCKITCSSPERFRKHMNSRTHRSKMETLLALQREKTQVLEASTKASQHPELRESSKKNSRKPGNWCTVCECSFTGNFLAHRRTKEHRQHWRETGYRAWKKRDKKYPKCRPCRLGFSSSEEYREHCKREDHKQRSAEFHYLKNLASGSDDDEAALEPVKVEEEEEVKKEEEVTKTEGDEVKDEKTEEETGDQETAGKKEKTEGEEDNEGTEDAEKKTDEEKKDSTETKSETKKPPKPKEPKAIGQSFVVSVQGYYCKLCHKFFKDVTVAKVKHCRSVMHMQTFKKAMEEALEQEEERQKLADEQDKLEREAAEASRLAAEIAAVEKAAKEAAKREAAEKKAQKAKEAENKETPKEGETVDETEKMDTSEVEQKVENGVKEDMEVADAAKTENKEEDEEEVPPAAEEEKPAEGVQSDSQGDEEGDEEPEVEKVKEETTSPATRRGRGRGRGQGRGKGKRR